MENVHIETNAFGNKGNMFTIFLIVMLIFLRTLVKFNWYSFLVFCAGMIFLTWVIIRRKVTYDITKDYFSSKTFNNTTILNFENIASIKSYQQAKNLETVVEHLVSEYAKGRGRAYFGVILVSDNQNKSILIDPSNLMREEVNILLGTITEKSQNLDVTSEDYIALKKFYSENLSLEDLDAMSTEIARKRFSEEVASIQNINNSNQTVAKIFLIILMLIAIVGVSTFLYAMYF
jgi:hypothetical protein